MAHILQIILLILAVHIGCEVYEVKVVQRDAVPLLSYLVQNNSIFKQVYNPTWMPPSAGTNQRKGLIVRTQDCEYDK